MFTVKIYKQTNTVFFASYTPIIRAAFRQKNSCPPLLIKVLSSNEYSAEPFILTIIRFYFRFFASPDRLPILLIAEVISKFLISIIISFLIFLHIHCSIHSAILQQFRQILFQKFHLVCFILFTYVIFIVYFVST